MNHAKLATLSIHPATQEWTLHLPASLMKKIGKPTIQIKSGAEKPTQRVSLSSSPPAAGSAVFKVRLRSRDGSLVAGPLLGILTVKRGDDFKGNKKNFIDIIQAAKRLGALVYVFAAEDIDWQTRTTGAYVYVQGQNSWSHVPRFPLPDVAYNRIPYREDEQKEHVQQAIRRLQGIPSLHLYNYHFFNKWSLYETLGQHPRVAHYVPETKKLTGFKDFQYMLHKYPLIYLKPVSGKAGKGIMSVETARGQHVLKYRQGSALIVKHFADAVPLWKHIRLRAQEQYVVQQGIPLSTYGNRPFDIRVLVQKDDTGTWKLSGVGIRVAGKNSITTHVPRGGSIASPEDVVKSSLGPAEYEKWFARLQQTVLDLASSLEEDFPSLGEVSMDIGMGKDGQLWFFEANAKPMKFDEPHIRKTSLERIIQYAQYLSDFTAKGEGKRANQTNHT